MLKNLVQLTHVESEKEVQLLCQGDTSTIILKNALYKFLGYIQQVEDAARKAQYEKENEEVEAAENTNPV